MGGGGGIILRRSTETGWKNIENWESYGIFKVSRLFLCIRRKRSLSTVQYQNGQNAEKWRLEKIDNVARNGPFAEN